MGTGKLCSDMLLWKEVLGLRVGLMEKTLESWALRSEYKLSDDAFQLWGEKPEEEQGVRKEPGMLGGHCEDWTVAWSGRRRRRQAGKGGRVWPRSPLLMLLSCVAWPKCLRFQSLTSSPCERQ